MTAPSPARDRVLCLSKTMNVPLRYILTPLRTQLDVRVLIWHEAAVRDPGWQRRWRAASDVLEPYGRDLPVGRNTDEREYPRMVTVVSPRMLLDLLRTPEDVVLVRELNIAALYAVLSKLRRRRRVVAMVEGDFDLLGASGSARLKVLLRRVVASFVDTFVANSAGATTYLTGKLRVPRERIVEGWWLAGYPERREARADGPRHIGDVPQFLAVGQLIPRKGFDLLFDGLARYGRDVGPFHLTLVGEGPQQEALEARAQRLGIADRIEFVGSVDHEDLEKLYRAADVFVFPTLNDLVGRVAVEALSVGTPVAASALAGAAGLLVREGDNGVLMDPRDPQSVADALRRATDPATHARLREGAQEASTILTPRAAADVIATAVRQAHPAAGA